MQSEGCYEQDGDSLDDQFKRIPDECLSQDEADWERMLSLQLSIEEEAHRQADERRRRFAALRLHRAGELRKERLRCPTAEDLRAALAPLLEHPDRSISAPAAAAAELLLVIDTGPETVQDQALAQLITVAIRGRTRGDAWCRHLWRPVHDLAVRMRAGRRGSPA